MYILTIMHNFTKYVKAVAMNNQEAAAVARTLVNTLFVRYGAPLQISTDQEKKFEGQPFAEMCKLLEIDKVK